MAIALEDSASKTQTSGTTITLDSSLTGIASTDVVIAVVNSGSGGDITSSWGTLALRTNWGSGTSDQSVGVWYKTSPSSSENPSFTLANDEESSLTVYVVSGLQTTTPYDKGSTDDSGTSVTSHSAGTTGTLSQADEFAVVGLHCWATDQTFTADSGFTKQFDLHNTFSLNTYGGYKITSATTALDPGASWSTSADAYAIAATFKGLLDEDHTQTDSGTLGESQDADQNITGQTDSGSLGDTESVQKAIAKSDTDSFSLLDGSTLDVAATDTDSHWVGDGGIVIDRPGLIQAGQDAAQAGHDRKIQGVNRNELTSTEAHVNNMPTSDPWSMWQANGGGSRVISDDPGMVQHPGLKSIKYTTEGSGNNGYQGLYQYRLHDVDPSTTYTVSLDFFLPADPGETVQWSAGIVWYDSGEQYISSQYGTLETITPGEPIRLYGTLTSPANAATCRVLCYTQTYKPSYVYDVYISAFKLQKSTNPDWRPSLNIGSFSDTRDGPLKLRALIRKTDYTPPDRQMIFERFAASSGFYLQLTAIGDLNFVAWTDTGQVNEAYEAFAGVDNGWHEIGVDYDPQTGDVEWWVDGVNVHSDTSSGGLLLWDDSGSLWIGGESGYFKSFEGSIGWAEIWDGDFLAARLVPNEYTTPSWVDSVSEFLWNIPDETASTSGEQLETSDIAETDSGTLGEATPNIEPGTAAERSESFTLGETHVVQEITYPFPTVGVDAAFGWEWNALPTPFVTYPDSASWAFFFRDNEAGFNSFSTSLKLDFWGRFESFYPDDDMCLIDHFESTVGGYRLTLQTNGRLEFNVVNSGGTNSVVESNPIVDDSSDAFPDADFNDAGLGVELDLATGDVTFYRHSGPAPNNDDDWTPVAYPFSTHAAAGPTSVGSTTQAVRIGRTLGGTENFKSGRCYYASCYDDTTLRFAFSASSWTPTSGYKTTLTDYSTSDGWTHRRSGDAAEGWNGWSEITDTIQGTIRTKHGRQHELGRFETGKASMTAVTTDDRYNPENTSSIWYPYVRPNTPVRIWAEDPTDDVIHRLWYGYIRNWPQRWTDGGKVARQPLKCIDALGMLARIDVRDYQSDVIADEPIVYYDGDVTATANTWRDWSGHENNHDVTGFSASGGSGPRPVLGLNSIHTAFNGTSQYGETVANDSDLAITGDLTVEAWVYVDKDLATADGFRVVAAYQINPGASSAGEERAWSIQYQPLDSIDDDYGYFYVSQFSYGAGDPYGAGAAAPGGYFGGKWTHIACVRYGNVFGDRENLVKWYINGEPRDPSLGYAPNVKGTISVDTGMKMRIGHHIISGGTTKGRYWKGKIAELAVYDKALTPGRIKSHYVNRLRFRYLDPDAPVAQPRPTTLIDSTLEVLQWSRGRAVNYGPINPGHWMPQFDLDESLIGVVRDVAKSQGLLFYQNRQSKLVTESRFFRPQSRNTATLKLTDDIPTGGYSYINLEMPNDDSLIRNIWNVKPLDGTEEIIRDEASIDAYGPKTEKINNALVAGYQNGLYGLGRQEEAADRARWGIQQSKDGDPRVESVVITGQSNADLWEHIMGGDISDRVTVQRTTYENDYFIEHIEHQIQMSKQWRTKWRLTPADKWDMWVLGDTVMSKLGETTILNWGDYQ